MSKQLILAQYEKERLARIAELEKLASLSPKTLAMMESQASKELAAKLARENGK